MNKIIIISSCTYDWGGSEELWAKSIPFLQASGFQVTVLKPKINKHHPEFLKLTALGVTLMEFDPNLAYYKRIIKDSLSSIQKIAVRFNLSDKIYFDHKLLKKILIQQKPSMVIVSQGLNFDGLKFGHECLLLKIPYIIVAQNAAESYWPNRDERPYMLQTLRNAAKCFFVSRHNMRLTEEQFGHRLANGQVVFNPVKLARAIIPYPPLVMTYNIACIARLFVLDKGQDILIRILSRPEWKERPVKFSFIGTGEDQIALQDLASLLDVSNIEFMGQVDSIEDVWLNHHALILPSRNEGLPLAMVEAMSAGRPVIVSNAGGNVEILKEGINGFLGQSNEESFGQAMERAWQQREQWQQIGENGAKEMLKLIPASPEKNFAGIVKDLIKGLK